MKKPFLLLLALTLAEGFTLPTTPCRARAVKPIISNRAGDLSLTGNAAPLASTLPACITTNSLSACGGGFLLVLYHVVLCLKEKSGKRTWRSAQADTREAWSQYVRKNEQWLYGIQTLRNAITSQTFLATTVLSLLTVISGRLWDLIKKMPVGAPNRKASIAQFALVAASMLASAYQFLQSARLMTHAGFMFPVSAQETTVDRIMRKSQNSQWAGLRFLYVSSALLSWIVGGPKVFWGYSALLTAFFRGIDKVPENMEDRVDPSMQAKEEVS